MKVVALISGGKDSCYNMMQCVAEGHDIVALANLRPKHKDEMDSYMFQTVGHHAIDLYADAMGLPLYRRTLEGDSLEQGRDYVVNDKDEVEDLHTLLKEIKEKVGVEGVSVGAILSDYQRVRVENVCVRLGLTPLAFLWRRDQEELMQEMISCNVHAIIIKVAALGLVPKHLGKTLAEIQPHMISMKEKYGLNVCGEGGEFETFTLDCPLFKKTIVIDETELVMHSDDPVCPVAYLNLKKLHLEEKPMGSGDNLRESLADLPMKVSIQLLQELFSDQELTELTVADVHTDNGCVGCRQNRLQGKLDPYVSRNSLGWSWISGLVATEEDGTTIADQTRHVLDKLQAILQRSQMALTDLVAVYLYVGKMADFVSVNQVYSTCFSQNPPIRVCVEASLPANVAIQVDCLAHTQQTDHTEVEAGDTSRHTMHVQGLSHWAPANFAPYSQAIKVGGRIHVAGQIALVPATMQIIEGGILPQCRLSLRSVARVLQAMSPHCRLADITTGVCYVTRPECIKTAQAEWLRALKNETSACDAGELEERRSAPHMVYVVVPALPKAALVEWQVSSLAGSSPTCPRRSEEFEVSCRDNDTITKVSVSEHYINGDTPAALSLQGTIEVSTPTKVVSSASKCMQELLGAVHLVLKKARCSSNLGSIRIFHRSGDFLLHELSSAYRVQSSDLAVPFQCPVPVFVPVLALQSSDVVMSFCH